MKRIHLIISGDVQGVGFRSWSKLEATGLGLTGWVKNREDRTVEIVAEGKKELLEKFMMRIRRGPPVAWVENVRIVRGEATCEFATFEIRL